MNYKFNTNINDYESVMSAFEAEMDPCDCYLHHGRLYVKLQDVKRCSP
jgi:hypothetical protein